MRKTGRVLGGVIPEAGTPDRTSAARDKIAPSERAIRTPTDYRAHRTIRGDGPPLDGARRGEESSSSARRLARLAEGQQQHRPKPIRT